MDEQIETKNGWRLVKKWIEKPFEVVTNCFRFIASSFFNLFAYIQYYNVYCKNYNV